MKKQILYTIAFLLLITAQFSFDKKPANEIYRLQVYHFTSPSQEKDLDTYFENALLPALHRAGIKNVGVFKSWSNDTSADKLMYVMTPLKSLDMLVRLPEQLQKDQKYVSDAAPFLHADPKTPACSRMETIVLNAFPLAPQLTLPSLKALKKDRVYELRSYESPTEERFHNKVKMFNEGGEIDLFKRLNFNAIFYGEVIAGSKMPNLMYMTSFESKADREEHWKTFGNDPFWKKLSSMPEYQNNVSHIDMRFLYPADYSDF